MERALSHFDAEQGLHLEWNDRFELSCRIEDGSVVISANDAGLRLLADHLMALAPPECPTGFHIDYDPGGALSDDSAALQVLKVE